MPFVHPRQTRLMRTLPALLVLLAPTHLLLQPPIRIVKKNPFPMGMWGVLLRPRSLRQWRMPQQSMRQRRKHLPRRQPRRVQIRPP